MSRHVAALPAAALDNGAPASPPVTCCSGSCPKDRTPSAADCAGALDHGAGTTLGVAAGLALGIGLGKGDAATPDREFEPFGLTDSLITAGSFALAWKGARLLEKDPPDLCHPNGWGCRDGQDSLGGLDAAVRRHLVLSTPRRRATAGSLSYATFGAAFALPFALLVGNDAPHQGREAWLAVESGAITAAILQVVKHRVNRPRPYAHYCEPPCGAGLDERDSRLSFFSGHAALSFSFAVSAGTIASMRSYRNAGWVLGSGLGLAAATSYLRIAADRHYFTDVLVGAVVGSAVGFAVPHLHGMRDATPESTTTRKVRAPAPALVVPVPLRGPGGGVWLHGTVGAHGASLTLTLRR